MGRANRVPWAWSKVRAWDACYGNMSKRDWVWRRGKGEMIFFFYKLAWMCLSVSRGLESRDDAYDGMGQRQTVKTSALVGGEELDRTAQ